MSAPIQQSDTVVRHVYLECTTGGSLKGYDMKILRKAAAEFVLVTRHGPIGCLNSRGKHAKGPRWEVEQIYDKIVSEKLSKGYICKPSAPRAGQTPEARCAGKPVKHYTGNAVSSGLSLAM